MIESMIGISKCDLVLYVGNRQRTMVQQVLELWGRSSWRTYKKQ